MDLLVPVRAAGCREEVDGWCCADSAPGGGDWRCISGREGGPLGKLFEPLFLSGEVTLKHTGNRNKTSMSGHRVLTQKL